MVPTSDASGTIVKVGRPAAATKWREGDRVLGLVRPTHLTGPTRSEHHALGLGFPQPGVLTEYRVFSASGLVQIPHGLSFEEAATLPIAATTAWMALNWDRPIDRPVRGPQTVVLLQGTGGVSIHALQQATALGLTSKFARNPVFTAFANMEQHSYRHVFVRREAAESSRTWSNTHSQLQYNPGVGRRGAKSDSRKRSRHHRRNRGT